MSLRVFLGQVKLRINCLASSTQLTQISVTVRVELNALIVIGATSFAGLCNGNRFLKVERKKIKLMVPTLARPKMHSQYSGSLLIHVHCTYTVDINYKYCRACASRECMEFWKHAVMFPQTFAILLPRLYVETSIWIRRVNHQFKYDTN